MIFYTFYACLLHYFTWPSHYSYTLQHTLHTPYHMHTHSHSGRSRSEEYGFEDIGGGSLHSSHFGSGGGGLDGGPSRSSKQAYQGEWCV